MARHPKETSRFNRGTDKGTEWGTQKTLVSLALEALAHDKKFRGIFRRISMLWVVGFVDEDFACAVLC